MILCADINLADKLPQLPISYLTLVLIAFMVLGLIAGLFRGFGVELFGLIKIAGVIFGSAFAVGFISPYLANILSFIQDEASKQLVVYAICFVAIWIVLAIVFGLLKRIFLRELPGPASRVFGGIIGAVKGAFFALVVAFIVIKLAESFEMFKFFIDNAKTEPVGTFLVDSNPINKIVELIRNMLAQG